LGVSRQTVARALKSLEAAGVLIVEHSGPWHALRIREVEIAPPLPRKSRTQSEVAPCPA
jgi:DNA-binding FadR family transcriptional regulator